MLHQSSLAQSVAYLSDTQLNTLFIIACALKRLPADQGGSVVMGNEHRHRAADGTLSAQQVCSSHSGNGPGKQPWIVNLILASTACRSQSHVQFVYSLSKCWLHWLPRRRCKCTFGAVALPCY